MGYAIEVSGVTLHALRRKTELGDLNDICL